MCGRFNVIDSPGLQQLMRDLGIDLSLPQALNQAPTEQASLVRLQAQGPAVDSGRRRSTRSTLCLMPAVRH